MSRNKRTAQGSGWNPGKPVQSPQAAVPLSVVYMVTEGSEDGDSGDSEEYRVIEHLRGPLGLCLGCLKKEFLTAYELPEDDENGDPIEYEDAQNLVLRAIETMRTQGYEESELTGAQYAFPRESTLFVAWLKREKGFEHVHAIELNMRRIHSVRPDEEQEIHQMREERVADGIDPFFVVMYAEDEDDEDAAFDEADLAAFLRERGHQ